MFLTCKDKLGRLAEFVGFEGVLAQNDPFAVRLKITISYRKQAGGNGNCISQVGMGCRKKRPQIIKTCGRSVEAGAGFNYMKRTRTYTSRQAAITNKVRSQSLVRVLIPRTLVRIMIPRTMYSGSNC